MDTMLVIVAIAFGMGFLLRGVLPPQRMPYRDGYRPKGEPVDLTKVHPPRQPSAVKRGGMSMLSTPQVPPKGTPKPAR